jgi:diphthine methyl ester synthase
MLYLIGLGLADETDITIRGLNAVKKCTRVYLESYTSILHIPKERLETFFGKERLETFFGKDVIVADREMVESHADEILHNAQNEDIAFLVVGDPFG